MMKHKHYDCIVAWAEGKHIECSTNGVWWFRDLAPEWGNHTFYRIKPEPKPDWVKYVKTEAIFEGLCRWEPSYYPNANLKLTFDGETSKLKSAEVI